MIPKEDADKINPWRIGVMYNAIVPVINIGKANENKLTTSELW